MENPNDGEHIKEVYARYGLAMYQAQVLEHGLANALMILDLIPSRRHLARSPEEWAAEVDAFMGRNFELTMGRLMTSLRAVTHIESHLDLVLREALIKRNWLAHDFFREHSSAFMSLTGREKMLSEVDLCARLFTSADEKLDAVVKPIRVQVGMTDEMLAQEFESVLKEARGED